MIGCAVSFSLPCDVAAAKIISWEPAEIVWTPTHDDSLSGSLIKAIVELIAS